MPLSIRLPSITYVVARSSPQQIIGRRNQLPWRLKTDLKRFKRITMGHVVIMGRNTHLSIGRALPGRVNIVLSSQPVTEGRHDFWNLQDTMLLWAGSREDALFLADIITTVKEKEEFFVIGGQQLYSAFKDLFNKIHLTQVFTTEPVQDGDATFDFYLDKRKWKTLEEIDIPAGPEDEFASQYSVLERKTKTVRYVDLENYYTAKDAKKKWIADQTEIIRHTTKLGVFQGSETPYQYTLALEHEGSGTD
jgi:dihydrofolate reductase